LRSKIATSSRKHRGVTYRPYAFTEHGAIQAANVLSSDARVGTHDEQLAALVEAIRLLTTPEAQPPRRRIGLHQQ
jgi:hypothetical protein